MSIQLEITGFLLIALSLLHAIFPKRFKWKDELSAISLLSRQLFYVHTFFIALILFLMGLLCVIASDDIVNTKLGHTISIGLFIFWLMRLVFQFFVYSNKLWKGKKTETIIHIVFVFLWSYFCVVFFLVAFN